MSQFQSSSNHLPPLIGSKSVSFLHCLHCPFLPLNCFIASFLISRLGPCPHSKFLKTQIWPHCLLLSNPEVSPHILQDESHFLTSKQSLPWMVWAPSTSAASALPPPCPLVYVQVAARTVSVSLNQSRCLTLQNFAHSAPSVWIALFLLYTWLNPTPSLKPGHLSCTSCHSFPCAPSTFWHLSIISQHHVIAPLSLRVPASHASLGQ